MHEFGIDSLLQIITSADLGPAYTKISRSHFLAFEGGNMHLRTFHSVFVIGILVLLPVAWAQDQIPASTVTNAPVWPANCCSTKFVRFTPHSA